MRINPYLPRCVNSEQAKQERKGSVVVKLLEAVSVLICVLLVVQMS